MFKKWIYYLGQQFRNPSLNGSYKQLKKSEGWSLETLENNQLKKLQEIVKFSYENCTYYKNKFDQLGVHPSDIKSLEDVKKLPVLTKNDVIKFNSEIHSNFNFIKQFKANTSGSSGEALNYLREEENDSFNRAVIKRGYSWYDVHPSDKNGYFWGFNFSRLQEVKTLFLDILQNRFRLFSYQDKDFSGFIKKLQKAKYIQGYSSMIYETAKLINANKLDKPKHLKLVKGTSEKIFPHYHLEAKKAFGHKIISEYGAAETGIIAFECPKGNMHITMEGVLVEEVDNEIIVTNLQLKSFPIIRYKLGDYIALDRTGVACSCGLKHKIITEVTGRVGSSVYGINNIYPSLYFYYIFKNLVKQDGVYLNYQVIQEEKGRLDFYIEEQLTIGKCKLLENEIYKYFKTDIQYTLTDNYKNKDFTKKKKSFISLYLPALKH